MTKIIELAHTLGEAIAESEEIKNLDLAQTAYQSDAELQAWLAEHETDRRLLADEFSKNPDEVDEKAIADIRSRMDELTTLILANANYTAFANAQKAMNELMTAVNDEIKFVITGVRPDHCTHDCSTCGGGH